MSIWVIVTFLILMVIGIPIAVSLGLACLVAVLATSTVPLSMILQSMFTSMNSFVMVAVPLFILAGGLMDEGEVADKIFDFCDAAVGWMYGGLGHVGILSSMLFAGMSGSSVADIASIGNMSINSMERKGFPKVYGTALNLSSSMLATIIPPSILMIIAASVGNVSIGKALLAGLIPGVILGVVLCVYNYFYCKKHNYGYREKFDAKRLGKTFVEAIPALLIPVIILGGMFSGIYTPTESAAIAVVYTIIISIYYYKSLTWKDLPRVFMKNAKTTGTILFIAITAKPAAFIFELDGLPGKLAEMIINLSNNPTVIMLVLFVFLIFVGMFMDATAAIYILVPILLPAVKGVGVSPIFFIVFLVITLSFGLITPPVGVCLYAASNVTGLSMERITKELVPWLVIIAAVIIFLVFFPGIVTAPVDFILG